MMGFDRLKRRWIRFQLEETGSAIVEMVLMTPILVWGFVITLQFFDAYRAELVSTKSALTVADLYSRETGSVNSEYLKGTQDLLQFLNLTKEAPDFRVTVFSWDDEAKKYKVTWSKYKGTHTSLNDAELNAFSSKLPVMSPGEKSILIETWAKYQAKYGDGIGMMMGTGLQGDIEFATFVPINPRFAPTVCWNDSTKATDAIC